MGTGSLGGCRGRRDLKRRRGRHVVFVRGYEAKAFACGFAPKLAEVMHVDGGGSKRSSRLRAQNEAGLALAKGEEERWWWAARLRGRLTDGSKRRRHGGLCCDRIAGEIRVATGSGATAATKGRNRGSAEDEDGARIEVEVEVEVKDAEESRTTKDELMSNSWSR